MQDGISRGLKQLISRLPAHGSVLDVGCGSGDFVAALKAARPDLHICGVDLVRAADLDGCIEFAAVDLEHDAIPHPTGFFDLVISQHVIEHLRSPNKMFGEMVRVTRPGGLLYLEAPSDRSTWFSFPWAQHWRLILSFYDDPTHIGRPWSPQALYRLGLFWGVQPIGARYDSCALARLLFLPLMLWGWITRDPDRIVSTWWKAIGWVAYSVYHKPLTSPAEPAFCYRSFKGRGVGQRTDIDR